MTLQPKITSQAPWGVPSPRRDLRPTSPWAVSPACYPPDSPGPWVSMGNMGKTWGTIGKLDLGSPEDIRRCWRIVGKRLPSSLSYRGRPPPRHRQMILWENKVWARPTRKNWPHCRSRHILSGREHQFHLGVWSGHVSSTNCHRVDC